MVIRQISEKDRIVDIVNKYMRQHYKDKYDYFIDNFYEELNEKYSYINGFYIRVEKKTYSKELCKLKIKMYKKIDDEELNIIIVISTTLKDDYNINVNSGNIVSREIYKRYEFPSTKEIFDFINSLYK